MWSMYVLYFNTKVELCACDQIHNYLSAMIVKIAFAILIRIDDIS